ncbi:MAG: GNAT family N-acetyltransferase [bacterium]
MTNNLPQIEKVAEVSEQLAIELGALMPELSDSLPSDSIDLGLLAAIIDSPDRDLFVARVNGKLVGSAVMNLISFTSGKKAWLEDFVVSSDESIRDTGVGYSLWQEIVVWSSERKAPLEFTSAATRKKAHEFYHRQGAFIKPTSVFRYELE